MTKIAVLGNCQVYGFKHAVKELLPQEQVDEFPLATLSTFELRERASTKLRGYDVIFTQVLDSQKCGPLQTSELQLHVPRLIIFPAISFSGFHPDQILLYQPGGEAVVNACGAKHSAIIAAGFAMGLSAGRVQDLFNNYIFEKLGYFSEFSKAKEFLFGIGNETGLDLTIHFAEWLTMGPFMHTNNHPSIRVLASVARDAVAKAGLCEADQPVPIITYDALGTIERWPVYPALAERIGLKGSYEFTKRNAATGLAEKSNMLLDEFIFECYRLYKTLPTKIFQQDSLIFARKMLDAEVRP